MMDPSQMGQGPQQGSPPQGGSLPVEQLTAESSPEEIQAAIQQSVQMLVQAGYPQDQAQQIVMSLASQATNGAVQQPTSKSRNVGKAEVAARAEQEFMAGRGQ